MIKDEIGQVLAIANKNLKVKFRNWQSYLFAIGFPIFFTLIFFPVFGMDAIPGTNYHVFDLAIAGMFVYAAAFGVTNSATSLSLEKDSGTLLRLDTTPIGRTKIFLGTLVSEFIFLVVQLTIMFILAYGIFHLIWYEFNPGLLIFGYFLMILFGISMVGMGILISAYSKTADAAVGISLMIMLPIVFLSGALMPMDSWIVYFMPPFYPFQIYRQVVVLGENFWLDPFKVNALDIFNADSFFGIPIWGAFLIIIAYTIVFLIIGIYLFQKKTIS
ncbi:MAG: ABC transporter permease [Promethearchaeota archaeon]